MRELSTCAGIRARCPIPSDPLSDAPQGELFRICYQHHLPCESERRKRQCVAPLLTRAQYNSCIIEDKNSNGMVEALILWQSIINSPCEHLQLASTCFQLTSRVRESIGHPVPQQSRPAG